MGVAEGAAPEFGGAALGGGLFTLVPLTEVLSLMLLTQVVNLVAHPALQSASQSPLPPYLFLQPARHWRWLVWQSEYCCLVDWLTGFAHIAHRVPAEMSATVRQTRIGIILVFKATLWAVRRSESRSFAPAQGL